MRRIGVSGWDPGQKLGENRRLGNQASVHAVEVFLAVKVKGFSFTLLYSIYTVCFCISLVLALGIHFLLEVIKLANDE